MADWLTILMTVVALAFSASSASGELKAKLAEIFERLKDPMMKQVAPGAVDPNYKNVTVTLELQRIIHLNPSERFLDAIFIIAETHSDPRLKWDSDEPDHMILPDSLVWAPDFEVFNKMAKAEQMTVHDAMVRNNGTVLRFPSLKLRIPCHPIESLTEVTCNLTMGSWLHSNLTIDLYPIGGGVDLHFFRPHVSWEPVSSTADRVVMSFDDTNNLYPQIQYTITLRRRDQCSSV